MGEPQVPSHMVGAKRLVLLLEVHLLVLQQLPQVAEVLVKQQLL